MTIGKILNDLAKASALFVFVVSVIGMLFGFTQQQPIMGFLGGFFVAVMVIVLYLVAVDRRSKQSS